jgi:hypothetical protein
VVHGGLRLPPAAIAELELQSKIKNLKSKIKK